MHGKTIIQIEDQAVSLWFNNYSKVEIGRELLPKREKGYPSRPEEALIVEAIDKWAQENYLNLLKVIINAGIKGMAYATNQPLQVTPDKVALYLAEAESSEVYDIWLTFLQAYGFDLLLDDEKEFPKLSEDEKKNSEVTKTP